MTVAWTPGAFELPFAAKAAAASGRFDAVVCLGAVIRGETSHFDFVAGEAARGIREAGPGNWGAGDLRGADHRHGGAGDGSRGGTTGNKGGEAALAAMQMVKLLDQLPAGRE